MSTPDDIPLVFHTSSRLRKGELRRFFADVSARVGRGRVSCLITGDEALRDMNKSYRGKDYATDVLSFPAAAAPAAHEDAGEGRFLGDLAISADRARAQARENGHSLEDELRILMLHGILHLAGMDHETDRGEMKRAEIRWRRRLGLPVSLIERAEPKVGRRVISKVPDRSGRPMTKPVRSKAGA